MDASMKRSASGDYRWSLALFPTQAYASEAGLSLGEYEDFFYNACLAGDPESADRMAAQPARATR